MNNCKIYGAGVVSSGTYNEISIAGSGKITGEVVANLLAVSGAGKAIANLEIKTIKISGSFAAEKYVKAEEINIAGSMKIGENLACARANISGCIKVTGEANVDDFYLKSSGSELQALHGDKVKIRREKRIFFNHKLNKIDEIEATNIDIEYVKAKRVCGENVTIGIGCEIETVEYQNNINVHKDAKIDTITKLC